MFSKIRRSLSNIPGYRTKREIVVIESDDWGSIRMPSIEVYSNLLELGVNIDSGDNKRFNTLDTLASEDDLDMLFTTLMKYRDSKGKPPVFTALSLCANPDFDKIKNGGYNTYYYEPFKTTLERYGLHNAFSMWKVGATQNVFYPEFHGREHLNVKVWMDDLKSGNKDTLTAFNRGFWGYRPTNASGIAYQAAFNLDIKNTVFFQKQIVISGLELFKEIHGRNAEYFVPPNGAIHQDIIDLSVTKGIKYVLSPKIQNEPLGEGKIKKRFRYMGMRGKNNLRYLTRNAFFEPSYRGKGFSAEDCLHHIYSAFILRKPAIISTHRVNYIGGLDKRNAMEGNQALDYLLKSILKRWPEVEFMTSVELGRLIRNDKK